MHPQAVEQSLLAKSRIAGREITLRSHLQDTASVSSLIFDPIYRVGRNFMRAFRLDDQESESFILNLKIAGLFHDIGKANEGFAKAIDGSKNAQVVRHEHLSAMILQLLEIKLWLGENPKIRHKLVLAAVLSHHLKAKYGEIGKIPLGCVLPGCELYLAHSEIKAILSDISVAGDLGEPPVLNAYRYFDMNLPVWKKCIKEIESEGNEFRRTLEDIQNVQGQSDRRLLAALKTALIVSDSVASGVVRLDGSIENWIAKNVHVPRMLGDYLESKIIEPCAKKIEERCGVPYRPASFQLSVAKLGPKSLLRAGCGSGKTLAAYYWAAQQLRDGEYGRVIFLYPTRGTATEGFKDYTGWAPDGEALLLHGQSEFVLESMLQNPPDSAQDKNYLKEVDARLYSLGNFNRKFFSATVDQFMSFLQFNYASICMSVILADSVVVLDEIHSFDRQLFNTTLEFLKSLSIPTLCMTATLPEHRLEKLTGLGVKCFPSEDERVELQELVRAEERNRYSVKWTDSDRALQICKDALSNNEKVLWVVNTVNECQCLAQLLSCVFPDQVICYHSRFKLSDREHWHRECINRFRTGVASRGVLAVTTQVCEMSLDMDADLLITELAPISSLIQRMGRANRHTESREADFRSSVYIYKGNKSIPYEKENLDEASNLVDWLVAEGQAGVSQSMLADGMEKFAIQGERGLEASARLFDSGYFAAPGELRDIDEFTVPCILSSELKEAEEVERRKKGIEVFVVPVPKNFVLKDERPGWLPKFLNVAPGEMYDKSLGFGIQILEGN